MRVILVHGFNSSPEQNFHPWLKKELEDLGFDVVAPTLPLQKDTEFDLSFLMEEMKRQVGYLRGDDILLGHSLGGFIVLHSLEAVEMKETPRAVILVASPWNVTKPELRRLFIADLDADVLMWKANEFIVIHSKDDELVPIEHGRHLANVLKAEFIETEGNDHFMGQSYPILRDLILKIKETPIKYNPGEKLSDDFQNIHLSEYSLKEEEETKDLL
jgi:hypothetical protein